MTHTDDLEVFELALEAAGMAWWMMEMPSGVIFFSPNKVKMLHRNAEDFVHYTSFTDLIHPEDYQPMMDAMQDHLHGKKDIYETTYRIKMKNGNYKRFYDRGRIVKKYGGDITIAGMVFDVTDSLRELIRSTSTIEK